MKTKLSIWLFAAMFGLVACTVNDDPVDVPSEDNGPYVNEPDYNSVKCDDPVFVSYNLEPEVRTAVEYYLTNITSIEEANAAVVRSEDISLYEDKLVDLYNRGGLIVLARPTGENFDKFADKYSIIQKLPTDASQAILLFAFDNKRNCYVLFGDGPIVAGDIVPGYEELNDELYYNKRRIFEFFRWIKNDRAKSADTRASTWVSDYDPYQYFKECQHIVHNYDVKMDHEVAHVALSSKDYLRANGCVEVGYDIYAAYIFDGNPNAGDYYIIKRKVTVYNSDCYVPYDNTHGGVKVWIAGYFMRKLNLQSKLQYNGKDLANSLFASDVTPSTTVNSTSYSTGFSLGLDGALSVGTDTGVSFGFSAGYESSTSKEISDLEISKETNNSNRQVGHVYTVKNIPKALKLNTMWVWDGVDVITEQIPLIARKDFDAISEWTWEVPVNTNGVADNATTSFTLRTDFTYTYGAIVTSNWELFNSDDKSYDHSANSSQSVTAPTRIPFGVLAVKNAHPQSIARINIWKQDGNAGKGTPFATIPSSYSSGETAKCALPEGKFYIEYDQVNGNTNEVISSWKIENVEIKKGTSEANSTTEVSTTSATQK